MAVVFDAVSSVETATSPATWTHTPVGTPDAVAVGLGILEQSGTASAVDYGGTALTLLKREERISECQGEIWGVASGSLPTGAQTVSVTFTGDLIQAGAITFTGADITAGFDSPGVGQQGTGGTSNLAVTSATDDMVVDCMSNFEGTSITTHTSQIERWERLNATDGLNTAQSTEPGATSVTMTMTAEGGVDWVHVAANLNAAAAAPAAVFPPFRRRHHTLVRM